MNEPPQVRPDVRGSGSISVLGIRWGIFAIPAAIALLFSFGTPLVYMATKSLYRFAGPGQTQGPASLQNFSDFVTDAHFMGVLMDTFLIGFAVVSICALLGYPVAYCLARTQSRLRGVMIFIVLGPLLISGVIRNLGWVPLLGNNGFINWLLMTLGIVTEPIRLVNNTIGVVIGTVHAMLPFMILMLMTVIQRINPALEEAALSWGASQWKKFWLVIFPLSLPGLIGGYLIVFTLSISAYTTPAMLGGNRVTVMSTFVAQQVRYVLNYPLGATAAVVLMVAAVLFTLFASRVSRAS